MGDFLSFRKMITPMVIQILFWVGVVLAVISGLSQMIIGVNSTFGGGAMVFTGLLTLVLGPVFVRIYCELLILLFRIYDELVAIRTGRPPETAPGFPVSPIGAVPQ